jgi:orotidine-5'-phosphate decarboxylase
MMFREKLESAAKRNGSLLCVGLDPDPARLPIESVGEFNRAIIEATADLVCAYKPNLAFYEALGEAGYAALRETLAAIPPHIPTIGDAKRGDIGNTARAYASAVFDVLGFDAVTVSPYLGGDSLAPFVEREDRGVFVLCRTSNPGASDFQDLAVSSDGGARPLYEVVAERARSWNTRGNVGLVTGATFPEELGRVRELCPDMLLLVPGVGAQAGDLGAAVRAGLDARGGGIVVNASRGVLYALKGADFARAARDAAESLRDQIQQEREAALAEGGS